MRCSFWASLQSSSLFGSHPTFLSDAVEALLTPWEVFSHTLQWALIVLYTQSGSPWMLLFFSFVVPPFTVFYSSNSHSLIHPFSPSVVSLWSGVPRTWKPVNQSCKCVVWGTKLRDKKKFNLHSVKHSLIFVCLELDILSSVEPKVAISEWTVRVNGSKCIRSKHNQEGIY